MSTAERLKEWYGACLSQSRIYRREIVFTIIIFFVAILSFGLGYLANREFTHAPIIIEQCSITDIVEN